MPVTNFSGDDLHLIERVKVEGDVAAFRELYDKYAAIVMGFTFRIVGSRELAEELTQETFWRIWRKAPTFDQTRGVFTNWMYGIARNLAIDALRRLDRVTLQPLLDERDQPGSAEATALVADGDEVAESVWHAVMQQQVRDALAELPDEQRDVLIWIYFEGKTRRQIASEQGIPFGTINTRARLALQKLQATLVVQGIEE